jgi:hypothetical protein
MVAQTSCPLFFPSPESIKLQLALDKVGSRCCEAKQHLSCCCIGRLTAKITNQERLLEVIGQKQAELIRMNTSVSAEPSSLPRPTQLRRWSAIW